MQLDLSDRRQKMKLTVSEPSMRPASKDRQIQRPANRSTLTVKMLQTVRSHYSTLAASALQNYTFARSRTAKSGAESKLEIFDGDGRLVFQGSEFQSGIAGYWRPAGVRISPGSTREKTWGRQTLPGFMG